MSNVMDFDPVEALSGEEQLYVVVTGEDKRMSTEQLKAFVLNDLPTPVEPEGIPLSSANW